MSFVIVGFITQQEFFNIEHFYLFASYVIEETANLKEFQKFCQLS